MTENKKKIAYDIVLNLVATAVPVFILQFVIYPFTAKQISSELYGLMVTMYSAWMMISNTSGTVVNNIRLIHNTEYEEKRIIGDYNVLLSLYGVLNIVVTFVLAIYYYKSNSVFSMIAVICISFLIYINAYLEVEFRLKLNYKKILVNKIALTVGYIIGAACFFVTKRWEFIFLAGNLLSFLYLLKNSKLLSEGLNKTECFNLVLKDSIFLIIATILASMMSYADKLVLFPMLGGSAISIYYTATLFGKVVSMAVVPVNGVILSYLSGVKKLQAKTFSIMLIAGITICTCGYFICVLLSRPILGFLYPQWIDSVMIYIPVTTLTVCISALNSILTPFVLKFCKMYWQIIINGASVAIYFVVSLCLLNMMGLMGFCIGTAIGGAVKAFLLLLAYFISHKGRRNESIA